MAAIENGVPATVDLTFAEGGRLLRRVDNDEGLNDDDLDDEDLDDEDLDDDDLDDNDVDREASDEERSFGDAIKKFNPATVVKKSVKKSAEQADKIKQALKEAGDYQSMLEKAREMVNK